MLQETERVTKKCFVHPPFGPPNPRRLASATPIRGISRSRAILSGLFSQPHQFIEGAKAVGHEVEKISLAKVFAIFIILTTISLNIMAQQKTVQTAGRTQLGEFAPEFAHLNDDILFGEVWSRNDLLSLRDRSLVTITSLISQGITDNSLKYHLQSAKNNGITRTEAAEIITHIAFYAGWPKAWAAFNLAKEVWSEDVKGQEQL